ncbi:LacI family DNA-binding transcriptional regulator [Kineococcus aurantiacus]|uniref:DNA-binding LacI/PurR family transcriptional regulator n=1 Tax=Kineococcus aurantiacus TaxID=37633 RepID=A0A7Y9J0L7_9ACTN|nr:LacI family DNA-binding transcriptional regulator [Kineococcus aurantiacus]NYD22417.1 DNA-binding LacI/PurR family transcriptional regulator [Kineococcus aurantiacus]
MSVDRSDRRPPAMSDVAKLAGVSHQTVSRVLNDHPNVKPVTRQRVQAAIAELGYRRNEAARALVTRRTGAIGVITENSPLHGPTMTLIAIENAARSQGTYVSVATVTRWEVATVRATLEHFLDQGVDGVVVIASHDEAVRAVEDYSRRLPVVMVGPGRVSGGIHAVAVDQWSGAGLAVGHLLDLGHRDVVHVSGPREWLDARARERGWRDAVLRAGLEPRDPLPGDWTASAGFGVGRALLAQRDVRPLPTAVFTANDQLALGLLHAFADAGVRVPQEVSVVGYDDVEGSEHFFPPLTTVRPDWAALGARCLERMTAAMEGEPAAAVLVGARLVPRASSGPARR